MKLMRHGPAGQEMPGLIDAAGRPRDLSEVVADIDASCLAQDRLEHLRGLDPELLPVLDPAVRLGPPVTGVGKIVCIGLNYTDHAREAGMPIPDEPIVFLKSPTSISGPTDPVLYPPDARKLDWEVELAFVIGRQARRVAVDDGLACVAGYMALNDISERGFQLEQGGQWVKGKSCDSFCPIGPWLVTADEVPAPDALDLWLEVNGQRYQQGNTGTMIFDIAFLVSYLSRFMTLLPGDIVTTGTPPGVGMGIKPDPVFLQVGDQIRLGVEGLGEQRLRVVADERA